MNFLMSQIRSKNIGKNVIYFNLIMSHLKDPIGELNAYTASLRLAHWKANTVTNEHKTLGDLYDTMSDLVDSFAETYMGRYGSETFDIPPKPIIDISDAPVAEGCEIVEGLIAELKAGQDDDLINIAADMQGALNKARYLLKEPVKGGVEEKETGEEEGMDYTALMKRAVKKLS